MPLCGPVHGDAAQRPPFRAETTPVPRNVPRMRPKSLANDVVRLKLDVELECRTSQTGPTGRVLE